VIHSQSVLVAIGVNGVGRREVLVVELANRESQSAWSEDNIEETLTCYRWPLAHHQHLKSTNRLERINEELKRRSRAKRIFPNPASSLRFMRALAVEIHEDWIKQHRNLNMQMLTEHKKRKLAKAA